MTSTAESTVMTERLFRMLPNGNGTPDAIEFETAPGETDGYWCNPSGDGAMTGGASTITAPTGGSMPDFLFTDSGTTL